MFDKLGKYFLFICRRERFVSLVWLLCLVGLSAIFFLIYSDLFRTQRDIDETAALMSNPAMIAILGNVYGAESLTQASIMAQECLIWFLIATAIMNIFLVNRQTRADEELGRLEMFRAFPVGRLTGSATAILFSFVLNLFISLLIAASLLALDIGGMSVAGAFVYGFSIGVVGLLFAALTLFAAQLFSAAHGVSGFGFAALILFYMMRASGDVSGNALSYISPLGLGLKVEAFYSNDVMPIIVLLAESIVLIAAALAINAVRDHGAGILPRKKGRAYASVFLKGPLGYAWRLTRGSVASWGAGIFLIGASYGSICTDLDSFAKENEMMMKLIGGGGALLDSYVEIIFAIMSIIVSAPVVLTALKIRSEEKRGRLEQIFSRSVPRVKLYICFVAVAVCEAAVLQLLLSLGFWATSGGMLELAEMLKTALKGLPAIYVMVGITIFLVGALPKLTALVWAALGYSFLMVYLGRIMDLPAWVDKSTPFGDASIAILLPLAAALLIVGLAGYRRRDLR
jgi:ABC-2 type transport system permease protein